MKYLPYVLILFMFGLIMYQCNHPRIEEKVIKETIVKQDTIIIRDTIAKYYPKPIKEKVTDTIYISTDDNDSIPLQIEEKTYTDDSTYKAVISGFKPHLKEIYVYPNKIYITTEKTLEIEKKHRFTWGLQGGVGYGLINRKPDLYIGIGGSINF